MFNIVYSDRWGQVYDNPDIEALAFDGLSFREASNTEMIPLPYGSSLSLMPERFPLGKYRGKMKCFRTMSGFKEGIFSVSVLLPNGYTRLLLPAYKEQKHVSPLPLFAYSFTGFKDNGFYVAAHETEKLKQWDPSQYSTHDLKKKVKKRLQKEPANRLLKHLSHCALYYQCYNAQNIFYERWEGGIPISSVCNAQCCGCISFQKEESSGFPSPQNRIVFTPSIEEIVSTGVNHLNRAEKPLLSFGQGCEGEPTLRGDLLVNSIKEIRRRTDRGTIHLNTNGSNPHVIRKAIEAGLDSIRIGLNSAKEDNYTAYFKPQTYSFKDVMTSIEMGEKIFLSINLLVIPGFTDREEECHALFNLLEKYPVRMVQLRNLNIDPSLYFHVISPPESTVTGMLNFIKLLKKSFPNLKVGSVNPVTSEQ
ncbi:MAG: radical SAM protein [Candidatus Eremiobacterota bacterium]